MKIPDSDLRHLGNCLPTSAPGYWIAFELLQRRAEVRRLRKALRDVSIHSSDGSAVYRIASKALSPQRKKKGQKP